MPGNLQILVADSDSQHRKHIADVLQSTGYTVECVADGQKALARLQETDIDVVITNLELPDRSSLDVLRFATAQHPPTPVIITTVYGNAKSAVEVIKLGAVDYLSRHADTEDLLIAVEKALERRKMLIGLGPDRLGEITSFGGLIGDSPVMHDVFDQIRRCAPFKATVLITGESGTGKELVARAIHALSPYSKGPFVAVNCSAIPNELVESTLFGHEKGAFTGAVTAHQGVFEAADGGTLFLDEIGNLAHEAQATLLRTIEDRQVTRLGNNTPVHVNLRLLAAINANLKRAVDTRRFREDLYYRLNVLDLPLPPLRDRPDDIPLLVRVFLDRFAQENDRPPKKIASQTLARLVAYRWPGNVRELKNITECLAIKSRGDEILPSDLPDEFQTETEAEHAVAKTTLDAFAGMTLESMEHAMIRHILERNQGGRARTAEMLGISLRTLQRKLKEYSAEV